VNRSADIGVLPVEVRLLLLEEVEVVLVGGLVIFPNGAFQALAVVTMENTAGAQGI
jgi:hypothetical protein